MTKVLVSTSSFATFDSSPIKKMEAKGLQVVLNPYKRTLTVAESIELLQGVSGLIAGTEKLNKEVLESAKELKVISRCGTGMESVDLNTAKTLGIRVVNTPEAPIQAVAELTLGLILALLRHIPLSDRGMRAGIWKKNMGTLLQEKTIGIVGLGRIGKRVCLLLYPFNVTIVAYDVIPDHTFASSSGIRMVDLEELLRVSDIVSVHVSSTECIIGVNELKKMKKSGVLVNISRGSVVDEDALIDALRKGEITGAALDVFAEEPYSGPLTELDNVVLTPHTGSYAKESRIEMETQAVDNLLNAFKESLLL